VLERDIFSRIVVLVSGITLEQPVKRRAVHTTSLGGSFRNSGQSELALDHSAHGPGHRLPGAFMVAPSHDELTRGTSIALTLISRDK